MGRRGSRPLLLLTVFFASVLVCQAHSLVGRRESLKTGEVELTRVKRGGQDEERELTRVKRGPEEEPGLTRVKRFDDEPGLTRVKRPDEEPGLTRVKRMDEEPGLTRVKRKEVEPGLTRVKRMEEEPGLTRVKRDDDEVELIRVRRDPEEEEKELTRVKRTELEKELIRAKRPDVEEGLARTKRVRRDTQQAEAGDSAPRAAAASTSQGRELPPKGEDSSPAEKAVPANKDVQSTEDRSASPNSAPSSSQADKPAPAPAEREEVHSPRVPPIRSPGHWDTLEEAARGALDAQAEKPRNAQGPPTGKMAAETKTRRQKQEEEEERELEDHAAKHRRNNHPKFGGGHGLKAGERLAARRRWLEAQRAQRGLQPHGGGGGGRGGGGGLGKRGKHQQQQKAVRRGGGPRGGKWQEAMSRRVEDEVMRGVLSQHQQQRRLAMTAGRASKRGHGKVWQRLRERAHRRRTSGQQEQKRNHGARAPAKPSKKAAETSATAAKTGPARAAKIGPAQAGDGKAATP